jgi:hypothetical protein
MSWSSGGATGSFSDFGGSLSTGSWGPGGGGSIGTASGTSGMSGASSAGASYGGSGFGTSSYGSGSATGGSTGTPGGYGGAGNSYGGSSGVDAYGGGGESWGGSSSGDSWGGVWGEYGSSPIGFSGSRFEDVYGGNTGFDNSFGLTNFGGMAPQQAMDAALGFMSASPGGGPFGNTFGGMTPEQVNAVLGFSVPTAASSPVPSQPTELDSLMFSGVPMGAPQSFQQGLPDIGTMMALSSALGGRSARSEPDDLVPGIAEFEGLHAAFPSGLIGLTPQAMSLGDLAGIQTRGVVTSSIPNTIQGWEEQALQDRIDTAVPDYTGTRSANSMGPGSYNVGAPAGTPATFDFNPMDPTGPIGPLSYNPQAVTAQPAAAQANNPVLEALFGNNLVQFPDMVAPAPAGTVPMGTPEYREQQLSRLNPLNDLKSFYDRFFDRAPAGLPAAPTAPSAPPASSWWNSVTDLLGINHPGVATGAGIPGIAPVTERSTVSVPFQDLNVPAKEWEEAQLADRMAAAPIGPAMTPATATVAAPQPSTYTSIPADPDPAPTAIGLGLPGTFGLPPGRFDDLAMGLPPGRFDDLAMGLPPSRELAEMARFGNGMGGVDRQTTLQAFDPSQVQQLDQLNQQPYGTLWSDPRAAPSTAFHRNVMPQAVDALLGLIPFAGTANTLSKLGGYGSLGSWMAANSLPYNEAWDVADGGGDNSVASGGWSGGGGSFDAATPPAAPAAAVASTPGALSAFRRRYLGAGDDLLRYGMAGGEREYFEEEA